ncbi:neuronal acetylcholine receptor subunit beta-3-like [Topomyia yanbarensis]|uniref:neuronal acetylcholine receptor subunit beta-3-like n=1 Tax=Topomyia yanbarensis TaxID=2498891 RepID=UPI00273C96C5|nr:neuronal acetylcholine receptor subunit beta-3-like [Topomyia yanbarensis]
MKAVLIVVLLYQINRIVSMNCDVEPKNTEAVLRKKLLCNKYDKSERPVKSHTDAVIVNLHMVLQNFNFVDSLQKLYINVWLLLTWKDEFLNWNPMEYAEIKELVIDSEDIWLPDMMPYSAYYSNNLDASCTTPKCLLASSGLVKCVPACEYHSLCRSDYSNWPFDRQNCTLRFGMWAEHSNEVDFIANGTSLGSEDTNSHNEWNIVSTAVQKHESPLADSSNTYPSVIFNYILERHSGSHCAIILTPAFIMVAINIISLWLNCCSLERLVMLGSNVIIHFLFIENLYWQVPFNGSTTPSFLTFFRDSLVITASLLVLTVFIKHIYLSDSEAPVAVSGIINTLTGNQLGQKLFGTNLDQDNARIGAFNESTAGENSADTVILVGENLPEPKKTAGKSGTYKSLALMIDRILYIGITVTYVLFLVSLIPKRS